ncbi:hypothetical protein N599_21750 [Saccharopolyspora erythraea D]|nr:hypothetical protein N599_21750 [Saccharopolyspora erythraea D]
MAQLSADGLAKADQDAVAIPAGQAAAFEVVKAQAVFEFAVVVFDSPAHLGQLHQLTQRCRGSQVGHQ